MRDDGMNEQVIVAVFCVKKCHFPRVIIRVLQNVG